MPLPSDYISGTITLTNGSVDFTGTGTGWLAADFREGDIILDIAGGDGRVAVVQSITSNTAGTLSKEWDGPTLTGVAYRIRYQWDSSRVSAQTRTMIEKLGNGNLESFSSVTGPGVVVMDGPHSVTVKPETDFINGVAYDVQVDDMAGRAAYDGQAEGFSVLVSDVGDGRSAVYSKASNASGDWTDPAYVTGPPGLQPIIEATVTPLSPGGTADVIVTPITGGYSFEFELPASPGFYWESIYNSANAYAKDSVVRRNGSSFIAVQDVPPGTQPSGATPPVDTAYWEILAVKGNDGAGTVTAINEGVGIDIDATDPTMPVVSVNMTELDVFTGDSGLGGDKGVVPAPAAGDASANKFLSASGGWQAIPPPDTISVSVLALQVADNTNLPIFGPTWWADAFDTLTYVDVAGATNLDTSAAGLLKPTVSQSDALANLALNTSSASWAGFNVRQHFATGALAASGSKVRLRLRGPTGGPCVISGMTIGHRAASGDAWDMAATPVVVTVLGSATFSLSPGEDIWSDWITFAFDQTKDFIAAFYQPSESYVRNRTGVSNCTVYFKSSASEINIADVSGYSNIANRADLIEQIQVSSGPNNLTVRSAVVVASSAPTSIEAIIPLKEVDAATPGTDYTVEFTRDNGTTWTAATVTELFASPSPISGIIFVRASASLSAQPSGTQVRWRIKTLTGKMIEFHGIKTDWK